MAVEIVTREAWGARTEHWEIDPMIHPAVAVWVFYTGQTKCKTRKACLKAAKKLQKYHLDYREWCPDMPFNFLIGGDGRVYEGRGWELSTPEPYNRPDLLHKRYNIAYIRQNFGRYKIKEPDPTSPEGTAVRKLIEYGVAYNYIKPDYERYKWDGTYVEVERPPPDPIVYMDD